MIDGIKWKFVTMVDAFVIIIHIKKIIIHKKLYIFESILKVFLKTMVVFNTGSIKIFSIVYINVNGKFMDSGYSDLQRQF